MRAWRNAPNSPPPVGRWSNAWPKPLGRHLAGEVSADELLTAPAKATGRAVQTRTSEVHYFIAMTELSAGRRDAARTHLEKSIERPFPQLVAYTLARAELARLRDQP